MRKEPSASLTLARAAGPWQTAEMTLLASLNSAMTLWEVESVARSNMAVFTNQHNSFGRISEQDLRPWPPTKKMASKSLALPTKLESFSVFFHSDSFSFKNLLLSSSPLKASTELGSRGASPPAGEATVM